MIYIEQPPFLPWLAVCEAMLACDVVALYDDVQYEDGGWQNRNRIKTRAGVQWVTVPVTKKHGQPIRDVRIADAFDPTALLRTLQMAYGRTAFYAETMTVLTPPLLAGHTLLADLNADVLRHLRDALGASCELRRTSSMPVPATGRIERIIAVCRHTGQTTLWAGSGTRGYLDTDTVDSAGITVRWNDYYARHPVYPQTWARNGFIPALSVVDAACNLGWADLRTRLLSDFGRYRTRLIGAPA
ncbi:WbqC family protein [Asanoa iriomotensis]|uniref:WbqC-like protein n=1 Tax=Asanoa iriomotensis TaxID=234613 RepID=A0ABQ4C5G9_9ACTN|nr:WbqC family protein [Asanoa iriomotensis]GIF58010.1 hypothetical protein Air01nite_41050 [Asanoa iriomotensis]